MKMIEELLRLIRDDLIHFVENKIMPRLEPKRDALKITADFILKKSTKTLKAVCDLCSKGYGEDAQVLGRTIFENALNLPFICNPDSKEMRDCLASLFILHEPKERQNMQEQIEWFKREGKCIKWIGDLEKEESSLDKQELDNEESLRKKTLELRDNYISNFEEYLSNMNKRPNRKNSWNLITIKDMSEIVGEPYECDYRFIYWSLSKLVHPSALGSPSYYGVSYPSDEFGETGRALEISFVYYQRIVFMVDKIFELGFAEEINRFSKDT